MFLFLASSGFMLPAQDKACKPALKANRHKQLAMGAVSIESTMFSIGGRTFQLRAPGPYQATSHRHVTVQQAGKILAEFQVSDAEISDPVYREYDLSGKLRMTDSLDHRFGTHVKSYPGFFRSSRVSSSTLFYPDGNPARFVKYDNRNGNEFVVREWYANRFPRSYRIKNRWESDSVTVKWDSTGVLREQTDRLFSRIYFPDGVLQKKTTVSGTYRRWDFYESGIPESISCDTVIAGAACREQRTFYPNGILKSVEYYSKGLPCLTWSFYTAEGILKNRIQKGPVVPVGVGVVVPEAIDAPEMFIYVEQSPEYPGGESAFRKEMDKRMAELLCNSQTKIAGSYTLRFRVSETGEAVFEGLEGMNAGNLANSFAGLFRGMPKWKPGKQNGHAMAVYFAADVQVKEK